VEVTCTRVWPLPVFSGIQSSNNEQLSAICSEYEGTLVTRKEVNELLGTRSAAQVVNLLDRRIDYVEQNVRTVQKQLEAAENKLAAAVSTD
jgi:unconventional prefoldin RPB5 interactor 1